MKIRYLFDENLGSRFATVLQRHYPMIDALHVGADHTPPFGTLDPDILHYLEQTQQTLVVQQTKFAG